jgi:hypothetical protein
LLRVYAVKPTEQADHIDRGRWYPEMPPHLPGETLAQYTDRLVGTTGEKRVPYDHFRYRHCALGWHEECIYLKPKGHGSMRSLADDRRFPCECPHHTEETN